VNDLILQLVAGYGAFAIFAATYLSCLAIPMPSSLMMLAGGAFAAAGDLALWSTAGAALSGAILGDQTGFHIGRFGGSRLTDKISRNPARAALINRARATVDRHGGVGVFFSTWLVAPLGPWVNLIAGATGLHWVRFTLWDTAGEMIWVVVYVGLGYTFTNQIETLAGLLGNSAGFLAAGVLTIGLGLLLRDALRRAKNKARAQDGTDEPPDH